MLRITKYLKTKFYHQQATTQQVPTQTEQYRQLRPLQQFWYRYITCLQFSLVKIHKFKRLQHIKFDCFEKSSIFGRTGHFHKSWDRHFWVIVFNDQFVLSEQDESTPREITLANKMHAIYSTISSLRELRIKYVNVQSVSNCLKSKTTYLLTQQIKDHLQFTNIVTSLFQLLSNNEALQ
ncbi:Hypothetical_protein [Hexamita inflata]|uniref:Hypothetical_protein n=1 Tax=Hexamita inflata TaxID=28002 RepID=A0AA86U2F8_9EUKA|nr:Hypothetical protein HINF_LOCUS27225 [Hexamita inflata]